MDPLKDIEFFNHVLSNGKTVRRARVSKKVPADMKWETVQQNIRDRDVIIRANAGSVLTSPKGKTLRCGAGYPLLQNVACPRAKECPHLHNGWKNTQHDQCGYLSHLVRHVRTSTCFASVYPECFAPPGFDTYCQIGIDGPICKLVLVSQLLRCSVALLCDTLSICLVAAD